MRIVLISTFAERIFFLECLIGKNNRLYFIQYNRSFKMKLDGLFLKLFEHVLKKIRLDYTALQ